MVWVTVRSQQEKEQKEALEHSAEDGWAPSRKSLEGEKGMQWLSYELGFLHGGYT